MLKQNQITANETKARWLQRLADGLSISRAVAGPAMIAYLAKSREYRTVPTVAAIGAIAATDFLDGKAAKKAKQYRPENTMSEKGAWLDQMADKVFVHGMLGGMAIHAAKQGNKALAGVLVANQAIQLARDVWVTNVRKQAQEHDVPTGARWPGRAKTATTLTALTLMAVPPLRNCETAQTWVAAAGITAGSALSVWSGASLVHELRQEIENSPTEELSPMENSALRIVLDDTTQVL